MGRERKLLRARFASAFHSALFPAPRLVAPALPRPPSSWLPQRGLAGQPPLWRLALFLSFLAIWACDPSHFRLRFPPLVRVISFPTRPTLFAGQGEPRESTTFPRPPPTSQQPCGQHGAKLSALTGIILPRSFCL